jgi:hypothetical protein
MGKREKSKGEREREGGREKKKGGREKEGGKGEGGGGVQGCGKQCWRQGFEISFCLFPIC